MAITATNLTTSGSTGNLSSYPTASITPTANRLVLAAVWSRGSLAEEVPTLSGNGLTWVQVATVQDGGDSIRMTLFRAMGASPSAGAVTIDFAAVAQTSCGWSIAEFADVDTTGTHGSGAVVQSKTAGAASGTAGTADFDAAFGDAVNNAVYSAAANVFSGGQTIVHEAGYTEIGETAEIEGTVVESMFKVGEDQTPVPTWGSSAPWVQIIVEVKAGVSTQALTGSLFPKAPTFFTGVVTPGAVALTGSLFTKAPTFFTGAVTATRTLTGTLFTKAPTFPQGSVTAGDIALTGVLFTKAPTFFTGNVTADQALTGVLFQKAPTFPTGTVTAGAYLLTGVLFQKAPIFPTGTIGQSGTIFGNLFTKAPTFFTGSLAQGGPSFWTPNPAAYVGVTRYGPSPWGAELSGQRFEKAPTFPAGVVS